MKNLTLYMIEDGLSQLIAHRAERLADHADPPDAEELAALEGEINKYQIAEPAKVARVAAMFRMWKAQRANIQDEIARLRDADAFLDACEARLKERVAAALELLPEPAKGCRKLSGAEGSILSLKGNGGVAPLQVDGWDGKAFSGSPVLPDELIAVTIRMTLAEWRRIEGEGERMKMVSLEPDNAAIREALARPCALCGGCGEERSGVCHCGDSMDGSHDNHAALEMTRRCEPCAGSGKTIVPGARMLPRGNHVECR